MKCKIEHVFFVFEFSQRCSKIHLRRIHRRWFLRKHFMVLRRNCPAKTIHKDFKWVALSGEVVQFIDFFIHWEWFFTSFMFCKKGWFVFAAISRFTHIRFLSSLKFKSGLISLVSFILSWIYLKQDCTIFGKYYDALRKRAFTTASV